jgi:hypothetical protein
MQKPSVVEDNAYLSAEVQIGEQIFGGLSVTIFTDFKICKIQYVQSLPR